MHHGERTADNDAVNSRGQAGLGKVGGIRSLSLKKNPDDFNVFLWMIGPYRE